MNLLPRIERTMQSSVDLLTDESCPTGLATAIDYAVMPGGSRLRPQLVMGVAEACGAADGELVERAAAAIELLHCASLVQDDLACFDDARARRGRAAVHCAFGERLAILASDALIVGAFDILASPTEEAAACRQALAISRCLARRTGARGGISAGQAWECESEIDLAAYHAAKTGALFAAASEAGAIAAGVEPAGFAPSTDARARETGRGLNGEEVSSAAWARIGELLGCAYQIADDLHDVLGSETDIGKPSNADARHGRPNAAHQLGVDGASRQLQSALEEVIASVPPCAHPDRLIQVIQAQARRFLPAEVARSAA